MSAEEKPLKRQNYHSLPNNPLFITDAVCGRIAFDGVECPLPNCDLSVGIQDAHIFQSSAQAIWFASKKTMGVATPNKTEIQKSRSQTEATIPGKDITVFHQHQIDPQISDTQAARQYWEHTRLAIQ